MKPLEQEIPLPIKPPVLASASRDFNSHCQDGHDLEHASKNTNEINKKVNMRRRMHFDKENSLDHISISKSTKPSFHSILKIVKHDAHPCAVMADGGASDGSGDEAPPLPDEPPPPEGLPPLPEGLPAVEAHDVSIFFLSYFCVISLWLWLINFDLRSCTVTFSDAGGATTEDLWRQIRCVESMVICWASEWDLDICYNQPRQTNGGDAKSCDHSRHVMWEPVWRHAEVAFFSYLYFISFSRLSPCGPKCPRAACSTIIGLTRFLCFF